jgi:hypothetical protein
VKLLLYAYPRRWRRRYGEELLALLEARPLTWRIRANVIAAALTERLRGSGPPQLRVLWAWSLFVVGGIAFQKTSEHWQTVVPRGERSVPTVAFDAVQLAGILGSAAVLGAVALALPAFLRDLRTGGWDALRRPIHTAIGGTVIAVSALIALASSHSLGAALLFIASALFSLIAWTHAATLAAERLAPLPPVHGFLAFVVTATMIVITSAAVVWFASVTAHAPSFVGAAQLTVVATFMLLGTALAVGGAKALHAR